MWKLPFSPDLRCRRRQRELMDDPALDSRCHAHALRGLERINWWSRSTTILWRPLRELLETAGGSPVRVLDLAAGAGDVVIGLWRRARRSGFALEAEGWDISPVAVAYARRRATEAAAEVRFLQRDALAEEIDEGYDAIISSLFLHHLEEDQALALLRRMAKAARRLVLINDLVRGIAGYWTAYAGTRLLTSSAVVRTDGLRSVEGAFTLAEARVLAREAGLRGSTVEPRWPFRFLLKGTPS